MKHLSANAMQIIGDLFYKAADVRPPRLRQCITQLLNLDATVNLHHAGSKPSDNGEGIHCYYYVDGIVTHDSCSVIGYEDSAMPELISTSNVAVFFNSIFAGHQGEPVEVYVQKLVRLLEKHLQEPEDRRQFDNFFVYVTIVDNRPVINVCITATPSEPISDEAIEEWVDSIYDRVQSAQAVDQHMTRLHSVVAFSTYHGLSLDYTTRREEAGEEDSFQITRPDASELILKAQPEPHPSVVRPHAFQEPRVFRNYQYFSPVVTIDPAAPKDKGVQAYQAAKMAHDLSAELAHINRKSPLLQSAWDIRRQFDEELMKVCESLQQLAEVSGALGFGELTERLTAAHAIVVGKQPLPASEVTNTQ